MTFAITAPSAQRVEVSGNWDSWEYRLPLSREPGTGLWHSRTALTPGQYTYFYIVDDKAIKGPADKVSQKIWGVESTVHCWQWLFRH
jgi:1,4-alpha-glucan branching enzyme